ncbi:MAG TPA: phosphoglycerate kinase [Candidatus Paceibacterota bacterium]|nr:phosphoglycerate kinase [Candidatus Paceibacterota bacterium]
MIHFLSKAVPSAIREKTVLLRLDFNTEDDWRMQAVIPTIKFLLTNNCKIVIVSHKGRPHGFEKKLSLRKNAAHLTALLGKKSIAGGGVMFVRDFKFAAIRSLVASAPARTIVLLDNLRFIPGEEKNDPKFAKQLASLADIYVNDAFAVCHRANASVTAITRFLPSYAGFELEQEIVSLGRAMKNPKHPFVLILGGAKAEDKLGVITFFENKADWFLLGGGPANTILKMNGFDVKQSVQDNDPASVAQLAKMMKSQRTRNRVVLPLDFVWGAKAILDFGPKTLALFSKKISTAGTILWSGPLGLIEKKKYAKGSIAIARAIARNKKAFSVAGGGETVMFLKHYHLDKKFSFVSTGGGAMVDFLGGTILPGIKALER